MSDSDHVKYLLSIPSVRARSSLLFQKVLDSPSDEACTNFTVSLDKVDSVVDYIVKLINRDYGTNYDQIPPHGRLQHFNVGSKDRITPLVKQWTDIEKADNVEVTKRLLDLFVVSVLLDAGAGNVWKYTEKEGDSSTSSQSFGRSEGIAVASLDMFKSGAFSNSPDTFPFQVNGEALSKMTVEKIAAGMQATNVNGSGGAGDNPMDGLQGRSSLMARLGEAVVSNPKYFGLEGNSRPGNILDFLLQHDTTTFKVNEDNGKKVPIIKLEALWDGLMDALDMIWPKGRTSLNGKSLGDAWPLSSLPVPEGASNSVTLKDEDNKINWLKITPFHKLTQWLCYSLLVPIKEYLGATFIGEELQTGLPEYRNGGLLVDFGVLTLKPSVLESGLKFAQEQAKQSSSSTSVTDEQEKAYQIPLFTPDSDTIIEWRALTVGFLDYLLPKVNEKLGLVGDDEKLTLPQLLEAGTWKAGREIAAEKRPKTKGPPIDLLSDGTVF